MMSTNVWYIFFRDSVDYVSLAVEENEDMQTDSLAVEENIAQ